MRYNNYHKHTTHSSAITPDTHIQIQAYFDRAVELGHTTYFTTEHGFAGSVFEALEINEKYGLKVIFGMEIYVVEDNTKKDSSNYHMVIIAKNNRGRRQMNLLNSNAHENGYYYKPRWSLSDLLSLNPDDVWVTTACVAGILNDEGIMKSVLNHFGDNLFIEIQAHDEEIQRNHNKRAIEYAEKHGLRLIHANDSHYIYPEQGADRLEYLKGKGISYDDEDSFILDYPDYDTILSRYEKQGVVPKELALEAINNTMVFDEAEEIDIDKSVKMPTIYPELTLDERYDKLAKLITEKWLEESKKIDESRHQEYIDAIAFEMDIVKNTNNEVQSADYFLLNYEIVKRAKEIYGGVLTSTGRGSAPSFYINKLLGFTEMDRLTIDVPIEPTRFISISRLNETKSLVDIDMNTSNQEPFIQASKDILGEDGVHWMVTYGRMQESEAFRNICRNDELDYSIINKVAKDMDSYREDKEWVGRFERAKRQEGSIVSISRHPCAVLILNEDIKQEIGLIRSGKDIVCAITSYESDYWKYLKNDFLKVKVVEIIDEVFKLSPEDKFDVNGLINKLDDKVWGLYADGITATLNQASTDLGRNLVMKYKPRNYKELTAFVAAIRPGFKSLLNVFLDREEYSTGVKVLDDMLESSSHFMMYQESILQYLAWLGIPSDETYSVLKKISKKKFKDEELQQLKSTLLDNWTKEIGTKEGFYESWQVLYDSISYLFSAVHGAATAFDSLYQAYLKSHYPYEYYKVVLDMYESDINMTTKLTEELDYFDISLHQAKFRESAGLYTINKSTSSIYKGVGSIKGLNSVIGDELYALKDNSYADFFQLLIDIKEHTSANTAQITTLIRLDYFSEFGASKYLERVLDLYDYRGRSQITKEKVCDTPFSYDALLENGKETEKQIREIDFDSVIKSMLDTMDINEDYSTAEKIQFQQEYLGYFNIQLDVPKNVCVVINIDSKYTPKVEFQSLANGKRFTAKVRKKSFLKETKEGSIAKVIKIKEDFAWNPPDENGNFTKNYNKKELIVQSYKLLNEIELRKEIENERAIRD